MKRLDYIADLFSKLGALCIIAAIIIGIIMIYLPVQLYGSVDLACERTELFLKAFSEGDSTAINDCMMKNQKIDFFQPRSSNLSMLLWDAYVDSITYEFVGECYASDSGLCRDVVVTVLDIPYVLGEMIDSYQRQYGVRIITDETNNAMYVQSGDIQSDFFTAVPDGFVERFLEENKTTKNMTLTFELAYYDGQWKVLLNSDVLNLLTGGMSE